MSRIRNSWRLTQSLITCLRLQRTYLSQDVSVIFLITGSCGKLARRRDYALSSMAPDGHSSLNQHLQIGRNLLPLLADILLRWRWHRFVLAADIEKMYRQILVHEEDRDLQLDCVEIQSRG